MDLGEPVYKPDQVILEKDLKQWWRHFGLIENKLATLGLVTEARIAGMTRKVFLDLSQWRNDGKPPLEQWSPKHKWEEEE